MLTVKIYPAARTVGFADDCFRRMSRFQQWDKVRGVSIEDLDKDGPDAIVHVDWKVDDASARQEFENWCMESFNRPASSHSLNGKDAAFEANKRDR